MVSCSSAFPLFRSGLPGMAFFDAMKVRRHLLPLRFQTLPRRDRQYMLSRFLAHQSGLIILPVFSSSSPPPSSTSNSNHNLALHPATSQRASPESKIVVAQRNCTYGTSRGWAWFEVREPGRHGEWMYIGMGNTKVGFETVAAMRRVATWRVGEGEHRMFQIIEDVLINL